LELGRGLTSIVQWRFFVIKGRHPHALKMATIALFATHSEPHRCPLSVIDGRDDAGNVVDEGDRTGDMVKDGHLADLFLSRMYISVLRAEAR
jgi:hypothetical protein